MPGVFLSNRGIKIPATTDHIAFDFAAIGFLLAIVACILVGRWAGKRQEATGQAFPVWWTGFGLLIGLPIVGWLVGGAPLQLAEIGRASCRERVCQYV